MVVLHNRQMVEDSEVYIKPVYMVRDPFRREKDSWLVLCDTWLPNGNPHPDNTRLLQ